MHYLVFFAFLQCFTHCAFSNEEEATNNLERYKIEGRIHRPTSSIVSDAEWFGNTQIFTNTGYMGFLRENGSFVINNLNWGSHVVQIINPTYLFESARVDISSKGKIRARSVNHIQPSKVDLMPYPLKLKTIGPIKYYQQREQWRITDFLFNPMVLMTVLPLLFLLVIPRLSDPDARNEMEQQLQMPKIDKPDFSEFMTNIFSGGAGGGGASSNCQKATTSTKSRSGRRKDK